MTYEEKVRNLRAKGWGHLVKHLKKKKGPKGLATGLGKPQPGQVDYNAPAGLKRKRDEIRRQAEEPVD